MELGLVVPTFRRQAHGKQVLGQPGLHRDCKARLDHIESNKQKTDFGRNLLSRLKLEPACFRAVLMDSSLPILDAVLGPCDGREAFSQITEQALVLEISSCT